MNYIKITPDTLDREHICCAISSDRDPQVAAKKSWLRTRMAEGLVFLKGDIRGKCFIEYIPAEHAWLPIDAPGYMHINCFWVSGSCKGNGYSNDLLNACIKDAGEKGMLGLTIISSPKKMPFLSDPAYLTHKGFQLADTAEPYFNLLHLPFSAKAPIPKFRSCAKTPRVEENGFALYYTGGCPFTAKYVPLIEQRAMSMGIPFKSVHIDSLEKAQNAPAAWTNYALFYNGEFVTHEILSEKKFLTICETLLTGGE